MDLPFITLYFAGQEHEPERTAIIIFQRTVRKSSVHCFGQSNDFAETKCFYTVIECTSLQSLRICLTQTAGGAVPVPPCREEVWMLVLLLSINFVIVQIYIYISNNLDKFIQPPSTSSFEQRAQNRTKHEREPVSETPS